MLNGLNVEMEVTVQEEQKHLVLQEHMEMEKQLNLPKQVLVQLVKKDITVQVVHQELDVEMENIMI